MDHLTKLIEKLKKKFPFFKDVERELVPLKPENELKPRVGKKKG